MIDSWLTDFFVAGGTLRPDSPSYVSRPADEELYRLTTMGEYCYVLSGRQMGKSSLMVRVAIRLREEGVATSIIDLTKIGTDVTVNQWYLGIISQLKRQLRLPPNPELWWQAHQAFSPVQRFLNFLRDVVLENIRGPVVIFIDEIDTTLKLDFSDDFFAAVRSNYNERARDGIYQRLTFALLGVATPAQLIKDRSLTPFNVGQGINLHDFTKEDAEVLKTGLEVASPAHGEAIFDRIFYWTNGHPYLTQKLCLYAVEQGLAQWTNEQVDELVEQLFLSEEASRETNLQFVRDTIHVNPHKAELLALYHQVYRGKTIYEDERSTVQNQLRLIGLVRANQEGVLRVRNKIYRHVFDLDWITDAMPPADWLPRFILLGFIILLLLMALLLYRSRQLTVTEEVTRLTDIFLNSNIASTRIEALSGLYPLSSEQADRLFFRLPPQEQMQLFNLEQPQAIRTELVEVIKELYISPQISQDDELLATMAQALQGMEEVALRAEIEQWLQGRRFYSMGQYRQSLQAYNQAIQFNNGQPTNPGPYFDRAISFNALNDPRLALNDLNTTLSLSSLWEDHVRRLIAQNPGLYRSWWREQSDYPALRGLLPTPTNTSTPSATPTSSPTPTPAPSNIPTVLPTATVTSEPAVSSTASPSPNPTFTLIPSFTPTPTSSPMISLTPTEEIDMGMSAIGVIPARIIYVENIVGSYQLGLTDETGASLNLNLHRYAAAPTWSAGGDTVAFFGQEGISQLGGIYSAGSGIWLLDMRDSAVRQLLPLSHVVNMRWSPDGSKIALELNPPATGAAEILVIDSGSGDTLYRFPGQQPAWNPRGEQLVLKTCRPECGLWQFSVDGSGGERLTFDSTDSYPHWSPDGRLVAFTSRARAGNWEIYTVQVNNGFINRLTERPGSDITPVFGPRGQTLYLRTDARTGTWQLTRLSLTEENEQLIRDNIGPSENWGLARPAVTTAP